MVHLEGAGLWLESGDATSGRSLQLDSGCRGRGGRHGGSDVPRGVELCLWTQGNFVRRVSEAVPMAASASRLVGRRMKRGARAAAQFLGRIAKSVFSDWESAIVKLSEMACPTALLIACPVKRCCASAAFPRRLGTRLAPSGTLDFRECLDAPTAEAIDEIEEKTGLAVKFHEADVGRGASGLGVAVEVVAGIAVAGGASAAAVQAARLVKWAYHKIASARGGRPMISLGAAEHLAMADLIDRVNSTPHLIGSGDVCSHSPGSGLHRWRRVLRRARHGDGTAHLPRLRLRRTVLRRHFAADTGPLGCAAAVLGWR